MSDEGTILLSESAKRSGWLSYPLAAHVRQIRDTWDAANADIPFWVECCRQFGEPVLCLCCDVGRVAYQLAHNGFEVVGVDLNAEFIKEARRTVSEMQKSQGRVLKVSFHRQDVVHLELQRQFALAVMPAWSFDLLLTDEDRGEFLKRVYHHLIEGGRFVFSIENIAFKRDRHSSEGWVSTSDDPRVIRAGTMMRRNSSLDELMPLLNANEFELVSVHGAAKDIRGALTLSPIPPLGSSEFTIVAKKAQRASS